MAIINAPASLAFGIRRIQYGSITAKSAWAAPFTGQVQSISHLADRLRANVTFIPTDPAGGALREAFFMQMASAGDWLRLNHWRAEPMGTLRGSPTVAATAIAGARTVQVQTTAGATLLGGDMLGISGQLVPVGYAGAVANGAGLMTVPLALPLRAGVSAGAAVSWSAPQGTFMLASDAVLFDIGRRGWQGELEIPFVEAYA